jgi:hypothetical protein
MLPALRLSVVPRGHVWVVALILVFGAAQQGRADDIWGNPAQGAAGKVHVPDTASWRKFCAAHFATLRESDERHQLMRLDARLSPAERERQWSDYAASRDETSRQCAGTYPEYGATVGAGPSTSSLPRPVCGGRIAFRELAYDPGTMEGRAVVAGPKGEARLQFNEIDFSIEAPAPSSGLKPAAGPTVLLTKAPRSVAEFGAQIANLLDSQCERALSAGGGQLLSQLIVALLRHSIGEALRPCIQAAPELARALGCPAPREGIALGVRG